MLRSTHSPGPPFPKGVPPRFPLEEQGLPPTLQPGAIFQAAPPPARRLSLLTTLCVYGIILLLGMAGIQEGRHSLRGTGRGSFMQMRLVLEEPPGFQEQGIGSTLGSEGEIQLPLPHSAFDTGIPEPPALDPVLPMTLAPRDLHDVPPFLAQPAAVPAGLRLPSAGEGSGRGFGLRTGTGSGLGVGTGLARIRGVPGFDADLELKDLEVIHEEIPTYPLLAVRAGIEGDVVIRVTINHKGVPVHLELLDGPPALRDETLRALRLWQFGRGVFRGRKVNATFDITFRYTIDRGIPAAQAPPRSG